mgnify:CR=1 FL=1
MNKLRLRDLTVSALRSKAISLLVVGCLLGMLGPINLAQGETVGERFRKQMEKMAALCVAQNLSPTDSRCILPKMKPADPLATEEGRFAHSIKIPNPVPEDSGYKPGMTPEQYFDHLCKTEAGEFVYKTVENVEGLYQMRPRKEVTDHQRQHLYVLEDLYGSNLGESSEPEGRYIGPNRYTLFETPEVNRPVPEWKKKYRHPSYFSKPDASARLARYFGYNGREIKTIQKEYGESRKSRYGYTWRGIKRPNDRELGITGGELVVIDLEIGEVLAVRRGYVRGDTELPRLGMVWQRPCPLMDADGLFIFKVLKPVVSVPTNQGGGNGSN